jgi:flagellar assembly factor FliW
MLTALKEESVAMVSVNTLKHGTIDLAEECRITFATPLLGFERLKTFYLYQPTPGPTHWMQSVEEPRVAFCLLAPYQAGLDPQIVIEPGDVSDIAASGVADIQVFTLVVLDRDPNLHRTNLRAPILVGRTSRLAKQVVLGDQRLAIKFFLRDLKVLEV